MRKNILNGINFAARNMSGVKYSQDDIILNTTKLIVGDGNMMGSILQGTIDSWKNDGWKIDILKVTPPNKPRDGVTYFHSGNLPEKGTKYGEVWLGLKPQQLASVAENIKDFVDKENTLAVSVLAGVPTSNIQKLLGLDMVVRTMPNTNSTYRNGQTALTTTGNVPEGTLERIISDFESIGDVHLVSEDRMNPFTAVAGSGPAYAHHIFGATYRTLREEFNLSKEDARNLVINSTLNPYPVSSYTNNVKNALLQFETSSEKGKEGQGKGSLESLIVSAAKSLGNDCSQEEIGCFVSGVVNRISKSLIKASESLGFSEDMSKIMVSGPRGIIKGSAITAQKTGKDFLQLKNEVTSVNGTTQAALGVIEAGAGRTGDDLCKQGLEAACKRGEELGNPLKSALKDVSKNLIGAGENTLESASDELVAVNNETTHAIKKLEKFSKKTSQSSKDNFLANHQNTGSIKNPQASKILSQKGKGLEQ